MTKIAIVTILVSALSGCITPSEKKAMQGDIFNTQTRLLNLEQQLTQSSQEAAKSGESTVKRIANTKAELDRIAKELQEIRGEIDALKQGVSAGALPGSDPTNENTVAFKLTNLSDRIVAVEEQQMELLDAINKAGKSKAKDKKGGDAKKSDKSAATAGPIDSLDDLEGAYDGKKYQAVADAAPKVLKAAAAGDKERVRFLNAEALFKLGKMRDAALKFNELIESNPSKRYLPLAKMRMGDCFRNLGDGSTAKVYYEELIKEFPNSDEAAKAKERMAEIGKGGDAEKG
jgi:TolA-binding protein